MPKRPWVPTMTPSARRSAETRACFWAANCFKDFQSKNTHIYIATAQGATLNLRTQLTQLTPTGSTGSTGSGDLAWPPGQLGPPPRLLLLLLLLLLLPPLLLLLLLGQLKSTGSAGVNWVSWGELGQLGSTGSTGVNWVQRYSAARVNRVN